MALKSMLVLVVILLLAAACGTTGEVNVDGDCVPSVAASVPTAGDPNRKIEDIIETMTGERQMSDVDSVEETIDDPNFAGVYGDRKGGIIVTVLDCSSIDVNEIAEIAGGSDAVTFVEVDYNWQQVVSFRDALVQELHKADVAFDVPIVSTDQGRRIEVRTPDASALPDDFGSTVPADAYTIVETDDLPRGAEAPPSISGTMGVRASDDMSIVSDVLAADCNSSAYVPLDTKRLRYVRTRPSNLGLDRPPIGTYARQTTR